jgi:hypothetical protein
MSQKSGTTKLPSERIVKDIRRATRKAGDNEIVTHHVFTEIGVHVTGVLTGDALTHLSEKALLGQLPGSTFFAASTHTRSFGSCWR